MSSAPTSPEKPQSFRRGARKEAFIKALGAGRTVAEAAAEAGYSTNCGWPFTLAKRPEVCARVAELARESPIIGPDLRPVIALLMQGARDALDAAREKKSAAGYVAATRLLAEAGRLKQKLPVYVDEAAELEWLRRWGPES